MPIVANADGEWSLECVNGHVGTMRVAKEDVALVLELEPKPVLLSWYTVRLFACETCGYVELYSPRQ